MKLIIREPETFISTPWKNGKGITQELAISSGGSIDKFDWRLSVASVSENGAFSNFEGYQRTLVLIEGNGVALHHSIAGANEPSHTDVLSNTLDYAVFDGGNLTEGKLINGSIKDLNIMCQKDLYTAEIRVCSNQERFTYVAEQLAFIYCLESSSGATIKIDSNEHRLVPGQLAELNIEKPAQLEIKGNNTIIIALTKI